MHAVTYGVTIAVPNICQRFLLCKIMPSLTSQFVLATSIIATGGVIFYVHKSQIDDKKRVSIASYL